MNLWSQITFTMRLVIGFLRLLPQLLVGSWKVAKLDHPVVTIFGGKRLKKDCFSAKIAFELARRISAQNIAVITGGGPGIMEAANCGAISVPGGAGRTMGIGVRGINDEEPQNACASLFFLTDYFYLRKYLLIYYSHAFVVLPGGFGTMDELTEVLTLMQTNKLPKMPVILIGEAYWKPFMAWVKDAVEEGLIPAEHARFITVTDNIDVAEKLVVEFCLSPACAQWLHRKII